MGSLDQAGFWEDNIALEVESDVIFKFVASCILSHLLLNVINFNSIQLSKCISEAICVSMLRLP